MSRFFAAGSDSESSGSESDVSLESFSSQESKVSEQVGKSHYNEFLKGAGSDSDSDDDKKIVKSQKEKRMQEMRTSVEGMADGLDDSNWLQVENGASRSFRIRHNAETALSICHNDQTERIASVLCANFDSSPKVYC